MWSGLMRWRHMQRILQDGNSRQSSLLSKGQAPLLEWKSMMSRTR